MKTRHNYFLWFIRSLLVLHLVSIVAIVFLSGGNFGEGIEKSSELIFVTMLTLLATFIPNYIEKKNNIFLPYILEIAIIFFLFGALFLGSGLGFYGRYFWWDDMLHVLSGIIIGFIGFLVIYKLNGKFSMKLSPVFVAIFAFTFALTIGTIWEIYEFTSDALFKTDLQQWRSPINASMLGQVYQGPGLRDTISDLIVDAVGAFITSIIGFFTYKNEKKGTLSVLRKIFPEE